MNLNIHNVLDWLSARGMVCRANLGSETITVDSVRWFSNDESVQDTLQVVTRNGMEEDTIVIVEEGTIVILDEDPDKVFGEFLIMFRHYNEIEDRALRAIFYHQSLDEIIEIASSLFLCPVFFEGVDNILLAGAAESQKLVHKAKKNEIESFDLSGPYCREKDIHVPREHEEPLHLSVSVWLENNKVGKIVICGYSQTITYGTIHLLKCLISLVECLVALTPQNYYKIHGVNQKLHMLLIDREDNTQEVEQALAKINWHSGNRYIFVAVSGFVHTDSMDALVTAIRSRCREFRNLYYQDRLILLGNLTYEKDFLEVVREKIAESKSHLKMTMSYPFYGWNNLSRFYDQVKELINYLYDSDLTEISPQAFIVQHLKEVASDVPDLKCLKHPDFLALREYDERHGTDYLGDLQTYLLTGCRVKIASELLAVHPNTMRYRLNKIEKLISGNMYDPDYRRELIYAVLLV